MSLFAIFGQRGRASAVVLVGALSSLCAVLLLTPHRVTRPQYPEAAVSFAPHDRGITDAQPAGVPPAAAPEPASDYRLASTTVERNFVSAVSRVGVSAAIAAMLVDGFRNEINFRRDLRPGNTVKFVFARPGTDAAKSADIGFPLAVRIEIGTRAHDVFLFRDGDGRPSYRAKPPQARAVTPTVSRFPLQSVRISSPFSPNRVHPLTGQRRPHDGIDLAAAIGTPVRATADGIVAFIGAQAGYGNVVKLRNQQPFSTTFAHLSRFAPGLRAGANVRRGDVIGYVGSTGHSTGPHLHYEVRVNGIARDPLTVDLPFDEPIREAAVDSFEMETSRLRALL